MFCRRIVLLGMFSFATFSGSALAEMSALSDQDLSEVDGQGVGLVLEDFVFSHGHDSSTDKVFRITGLTNSAGEAVTVNVNQLYIARTGSDHGSVLEGVNLGRLNNPYEIDLLNGDDLGLANKTVLQFASPSKLAAGTGFDCLDASAVQGSGDCASRPAGAGFTSGERPDLGLELAINTPGNAAQNLNFHVQSAVFDGSYLRLWGDDNANKMAAEFRLNFYTPELKISTCSQSDQACSAAVKMKGFEMELALGHSFQPLYWGADATTGGMTLALADITEGWIANIDSATGQSDGSAEGAAAYAFYQDYYSNPEYRSNIRINELDMGGTSLGSAKIEGVLVQHLDLKFRDLEP